MKKIIASSIITFCFSSIFYAQTSTALNINDTRWINDTPNFFEHGIRADFKERNYIYVPGNGTYSTTLTIAQWENTNNSGDKNHQLNFNNGGIFYRNAYPLDGQWGNWREIIMTNSNGNVGIGTIEPLHKLDVDGTIHSKSLKIESTTDTFAAHFSGNNLTNGIAAGTSADNIGIIQGYSKTFSLINNIAFQPYGGNVGIGTTNPKNKLDVKGTIHSQEVKVDMLDWSDFVFKKEYKLPTLEEVEKHITEKGHLENIPSEEEVLKNGINLGEMNSKLLQKIEEMTLYIIEQEKKSNKQSQQIDLLNEKLSKIEKLINSK